MKKLKSIYPINHFLLLNLLLIQFSWAEKDHQSYLTSFTWKFGQKKNGLVLEQLEPSIADFERRILWNLENFDEVYGYVFQTLHNYAKAKKRPLDKKQIYIDSAMLEIVVEDQIVSGNKYFVFQYNLDSKNVYESPPLEKGKNQIILTNIKRSSRIGIVGQIQNKLVKAPRFIMKQIVAFGKAGETRGPSRLRRLNKKGIKKYSKSLLKPSLKWRSQCGLPLYFLKSKNWELISQSFINMGGLCNLQRKIDLVQFAGEFLPTGNKFERPQEPEAPIFTNKFPLEPKPPIPPVKPKANLSKKDKLIYHIINDYKKHTDLDLDQIRKKNSAFLIDLSGSIRGLLLDHFKTELKLLAYTLEKRKFVSLYPMGPSFEQAAAYIANFQKVSENDSEKLIQVINSIDAHPDFQRNWDHFYYALMTALMDKNLETINILGDSNFKDRDMDLTKGQWRKLVRKVNNREIPVTINVFNYSNAETSEIGTELIKLGTGKGRIIKKSNFSTDEAKKSLNFLQRIEVNQDIDKLLKELKINVDKQFAEQMEEYHQQYNQFLDQFAKYEDQHRQWQEDVKLYQMKKSQYEVDLINYKKLYQQWLDDINQASNSSLKISSQADLDHLQEEVQEIVMNLKDLQKQDLSGEEKLFIQNMIEQFNP